MNEKDKDSRIRIISWGIHEELCFGEVKCQKYYFCMIIMVPLKGQFAIRRDR